MPVIKAFLVFSVASFDLSVMSWRVRFNVLDCNAESCCGRFKCGQTLCLVRTQTIGKFKAIVCLDAVDFYAVALVKLNRVKQKVFRRIGALLFIGFQIAQAGVFVDRGVLNQAIQCGFARFTCGGHNLHIDLNTFPRKGHLLIGLWLIDGFGWLCLKMQLVQNTV